MLDNSKSRPKTEAEKRQELADDQQLYLDIKQALAAITNQPSLQKRRHRSALYKLPHKQPNPTNFTQTLQVQSFKCPDFVRFQTVKFRKTLQKINREFATLDKVLKVQDAVVD